MLMLFPFKLSVTVEVNNKMSNLCDLSHWLLIEKEIFQWKRGGQHRAYIMSMPVHNTEFYQRLKETTCFLLFKFSNSGEPDQYWNNSVQVATATSCSLVESLFNCRKGPSLIPSLVKVSSSSYFLWTSSSKQAAQQNKIITFRSETSILKRIASSAFHVLPGYHFPTIPPSEWSSEKSTTNRFTQANINHRTTLPLFRRWSCVIHVIVKQHSKTVRLMW